MSRRGMRSVKARYTWDRLMVSFWFAPAVMAVVAVMLAWTMYWIDELIPNELLKGSRFILSGNVIELRTFLLSMATTTLATAGVVFTLLTLPLSTVAAQYGSRLLRLFLGDRTTQIVLGMFVGTFVYCIAAALSIPAADLEPEAPQISASVGLLLMLATFASLVLLIQHISTMLQAPNIAAAAGAELLELVSTQAPDEVVTSINPSQNDPDTLPLLMETEGYPIYVEESGYIQNIDPEYILTAAQEQNLVIRLVRKPGYFVVHGTLAALIWPRERVNERLAEQIRQAIRIGNQRTPIQDVEYAVNQLVEMAVRAMSPAINDPYTAITCLDHLGNGLAQFAKQGGEKPDTYDVGGHLRLVFEPVTFDELLSAAFDMLRHASCDNATVLLHMLEVIRTISQETELPEARQELARHISLIQTESRAGALIEQDRQLIHLRGEALEKVLNEYDIPL